MEHGHPLRDRLDELHVMLDDDHRRGLVDFENQVGGLVDLFVGHARRRLVEQDQLGLAGKHGAELDPLALAVGELADDATGEGTEAKTFQNFVDDAVGLAAAVVATGRNPDVLVHAQPVKHARHLRLDADAAARDLVGVGAGDVGAPEADPPGGCLVLVGQALEEGALAGAVGADQAAQLAFGHGEVDVVDRDHAAEAHGQPVRLQDGQCVRRCVCHCAASRLL